MQLPTSVLKLRFVFRLIVLQLTDVCVQMRKALSTMQAIDETERIKVLAQQMSTSLSEMEEFQIEALLEELQYLCEDIDRASVLHALKGLAPTLHLLSSPHAGIRQRAAYLLGTCAQNNPKVQQQVWLSYLLLCLFSLSAAL